MVPYRIERIIICISKKCCPPNFNALVLYRIRHTIKKAHSSKPFENNGGESKVARFCTSSGVGIAEGKEVTALCYIELIAFND